MTPFAVSISVFIVSGTLFVSWAILTTIEHYRMQRLFLPRVRSWLDDCLIAIRANIAEKFHRAAKFKIVLSWYYAVHAFLITVMRFLASLYEAIEVVVMSNRTKVKKIRREKKLIEQSYLGSIGEHKKTTALNEKQKQRLKDKSIEPN
jgi:hypothetical protein